LRVDIKAGEASNASTHHPRKEKLPMYIRQAGMWETGLSEGGESEMTRGEEKKGGRRILCLSRGKNWNAGKREGTGQKTNMLCPEKKKRHSRNGYVATKGTQDWKRKENQAGGSAQGDAVDSVLRDEKSQGGGVGWGSLNRPRLGRSGGKKKSRNCW